MVNVRTALVLAAALSACSNEVGKDHSVGSGATVSAVLEAPGNLSGVAQAGGTQIALAWEDRSSGETGFRIDVSDRAISGPGDVLAFYLVAADSTGYVYGAAPGQTRYFRVLAVTATLESDPSNVISVTTPAVPGAPVLIGSLTGPAQVGLQWVDNYVSETGYRIERAVNGGAWSTLATPEANATTYTDGGLAADTSYCYRVFVSNDQGESLPSSAVCLTTPAAALDISSPAPGGLHTSIAIDASGKEHISHYNSGLTDTMYTTNAGGSFETRTADSGPSASAVVGYDGTSIVAEPGGTVHIAAYQQDLQDLRYAWGGFAAMSPATVDSAGFIGSMPRIARSPLDSTIQIVYRGGPGEFLRRATLSGGTWAFDSVATGGQILMTSFAIDAAGTAHVAYADVDAGGTQYSVRHGTKPLSGTWSFGPVVTGTALIPVSLALDGSGNPHLVYSVAGALYHAENAAGGWSSEVIHPAAGFSASEYNAIAIDAGSGRIHVAYHDAYAYDLLYARKDPGGSWVRKTIDSLGVVGQYCSIAVEASGVVHFAYYDASYVRLKRCSGRP